MKALTVLQPWAELIACGKKRIENRTWQTHYRGPIAIHAGKSRSRLGESDLWDGNLEANREFLDFGAVIAVAELVVCVRFEELLLVGSMLGGDLASDPYAQGPWCWILANVRRLPQPIPCPGKQGLWNLPAPIERELV